MSPAHRRPMSTTRRALLGAAAAAAVSGAAVGVQQIRKHDAPDSTLWTEPARPGNTGQASAVKSPAAAKPTPATGFGGPVAAVPGKTMRGSYLSLKDMTYREALALREEQLGREERIAHVFYGWYDTLPSKIDGMPDDAVPLVSWRGTNYNEILSGKADEVITRAARRLRAFDRPVLLRWGWEMNGNWFAWGASKNGNNPRGYIDCWKYLRKVFKEEGADNVAWVWSVNWNSHPNKSWNQYQSYYPGDAHVDWVGISGYNLQNESPETLYDRLYKGFATRKPMMITELGSVDRGGNSKGDWIAKLTAYVEKRPNICGVVWFDTDTHEAYHELWRVDTDAHALKAYRKMARNPRFAG